MKIRLPLIYMVGCLLISTIVFCQCYPSFYANHLPALNHMAISPNGVMVAVGAEGSPMLRSSDDGQSWEKVPVGNYGSFKKAFFTSGSIGYAYTQNVLLKTDDTGKTWFPVIMPLEQYRSATNYLYGAFFINDDKGFVVNGYENRLYRTNNGGKTLSDTAFKNNVPLLSVHFSDPMNGVLFSYGRNFFKTEDGGNSWVKKSINLQDSNVADMKMASPDTLFSLLKSGKIIRSVDSGNTWTTQHSFFGDEFNFEILIVSSLEIHVLTGREIIRSLDGGNTWTALTNLPEITFNGLSISPDKQTIAIAGGMGGSGHFSQFMAISKDKGNHWDTLTFIMGNSTAMHFLDGKKGYLCAGYNWLFKTINGGITWKKTGGDLPFAGEDYEPVKKIHYVNDSFAIVYSNRLFVSSDSGQSWKATNLPAGFDKESFKQFQFLTVRTGFIADANGIYRTRNGGSSWTKVLSFGFEYWLRDFHIDPVSGVGVAAGFQGFVWRTQDFGATWQTVTFPNNVSLASAYVVNSSLAFMGTDGKILYRSTNGGLSWQSRLLDNYDNIPLKYFLFSGSDTGVVVSGLPNSSARMFATTDGGDTWELEDEFSIVTGISGTIENKIFLNPGNGIMFKQIPAKLGKVGYINGLIKTCVGQKVVYKTYPVAGAAGYIWNASGNPIHFAAGNSDTLMWNTPGTYEVSVSVFDECSSTQPQTITVEVIPFEPEAAKLTDTLVIANGGIKYQWFLNGGYVTPVMDSSGRTFRVRESGRYKASVQNETGCTLFTNEVYMIVPTYDCVGQDLLLDGFTSSYANQQWQMDSGSGYQDISNSLQFVGVNQDYLIIRAAGPEFSGRSFRCRYERFGRILYGGETKIVFANAWKGTTSNNWENPLNWSCGSLPDETTEVTILSGTLLIQSNVTIKKLYVAPGASVNVLPGFTLEIKG